MWSKLPYSLNETHEPALSSWVESGNAQGGDFPIQNLPFAEFRRRGSREEYRGGVAIGDQIVDLAAVSDCGLFDNLAERAALASATPALNELMGMGASAWSALRLALSRALRTGATEGDCQAMQGCLMPQAEAEFTLPCRIGDYTDFYTSVYHATSIGRQFRPDNPLLPNYKWIPIGYHGRSSSIVISGHEFHRPVGQLKAPDDTEPVLAPCRRLDHELELGIFIGSGNGMGERIDIDTAEEHIFGLCLFNDWSARDIQGWEYQPLGPFLAKNFASTISPWIVTMEALVPFRAPFTRPTEDPQPLPYLDSDRNSAEGGIDIRLQALIQTAKMRTEGIAPQPLSSSSFRHSYWTVAQMVAHHTVNGCNLQPGDLFGSGTQSGPKPEEAGSFLELSEGGRKPLELENGEMRSFLEDGDTLILRGHCQREGTAFIGFGEATGTVLPTQFQTD